MRSKIKELMDLERSGKDRHKCDIIRVLLMFNGVLWLSELVLDLNEFYSTLEEEEKVEKEVLSEELKVLEEMGFVKMEDRIKADLMSDRGVKDSLIHLVKLGEISGFFREDERLLKYARRRRETFRRYFEER